MSITRVVPKLIPTMLGEHLGPERLLKVQKKRLKRLLRHTLSKSRFYSDFYSESGITRDNIEQISIEDLPVVDKELLMGNYDDVVCNHELGKDQLEAFVTDPQNIGKKYKGRYAAIHTSGSTGTIGLFVYGRSEWSQVKSLSLLRIGRARLNPFNRDKYTFIGALDGNFAAASLSRDVPPFLAKSQCISINDPIEKISANIDKFKPTLLCGYASGIHLLAQQQLDGKINIHPRRVLCTGDALTKIMRGIITQAFGVEPNDFYGTSEAMAFGIECDEYRRHHLFEDWVICEVLDDQLHPVQAGTPGRLYITNLYNYTQPLIRYAMNDEITLSKETCPCGRPFRIVDKIAGRREEFLWFNKPDNSREFIHPIVLVEFLVPGLERCQFIQTDPDKLLVKAVVRGDQNAAVGVIKERMTKILAQKGLKEHVKVEIELTNAIENDARTGKFRLIIPYQLLR
ncbi:MAG: phenylacetate--CoA ligase family protein [candidate division Zixibacteria bacterium]|nr:phenylacetate--CoA ligase family protein [candidate division Zixibacteria bacterium]NIR62992.1 phenylacetate--CoA ligase family protein [candidate division Zixibacteria bacterium]NIS16372.1 phenylacetate--CoA ligase family protein [candidate division Zixibacteria bacterium]NIS45024.1 phenylacetate--CoA ligase family protein [candidate division Zixibacteria bacterium]NIT52734.1 phenylacetate--CoA ligase family protein [candidate division Zixibacteria bacterium]